MNQFLKSVTTRRDKIEVRLWYGDWGMTTLEWNWAKNKFQLNLREKKQQCQWASPLENERKCSWHSGRNPIVGDI